MKKAYITPAIEVITIAIRKHLLTISGGITEGDAPSIGYGGVDIGGTIIPAAREFDGLLEQIQIMEILTE